MNERLDDNLVRQGIWELVLPSFIIAEFIAVLAALFLSLNASRRISVPLYKMNQFAMALQEGDLRFRMHFRKDDELEELAASCNGVVDKLAVTLKEVSHILEKSEIAEQPEVKKLRLALNRLDAQFPK